MTELTQSRRMTKADLRQVSGFEQQAKIRAWLTENGIPYASRADGWPQLTWSVFEQSLLNKNRPAREPNFARMDKAG